MEIISDLCKIKLLIDELRDDGEFRIYFEYPANFTPDLKALNSLRELFDCLTHDFYIEPEDLNEDVNQVHGYLKFPYKFDIEEE